MIGHVLFLHLSSKKDFAVYATTRNPANLINWFPQDLLNKIISGVDVYNFNSIIRVFADIKPEIVINCIGLIKQMPQGNDPLSAITINALFPHRVSLLSRSSNAKFIHISTDCVFDGKKSNYIETDSADATDLYGRSKFLGEVEYPNCITLRTSAIGHELKGKHELIEWFLSRQEKIHGYSRAIYSGFPTIELSRIIAEFVIPNDELNGLYHVSSDPISKYDLLRLVAQKYNKKIEIEPYDLLHLDRSLDSSLFRKSTGYKTPTWPELVEKMHNNYMSNSFYKKPEYKG